MQNSEFLNLMVELERAINKAHSFAEHEFIFSGHMLGFGADTCTEWYNAMKCLEAMTDIKCTIHAQGKEKKS